MRQSPLLHVASPSAEKREDLQGRVSGNLLTSPTLSSKYQVPLLVPKLHLPRLHASLVSRERLLDRLDAGLERKLTLLSAPAGFGKTTLGEPMGG